MLVGRFIQFIIHNAQCTILAARGSALDTGWVACGEKLNRSLCSLKIKLFLDAGGAVRGGASLKITDK